MGKCILQEEEEKRPDRTAQVSTELTGTRLDQTVSGRIWFKNVEQAKKWEGRSLSSIYDTQ